jgi:putative ABC transport system permease protein
MNFFLLILKNISQYKIRTALTVLGISIGIATIIALNIMSLGFLKGAEDVFNSGEMDFMVIKAGAADVVLSYLTSDQLKKIGEVPGVAQTIPLTTLIISVKNNPYFLAIGIEPKWVSKFGAKIIEGNNLSSPEANQILLGKVAARSLNKKVGDYLVLNKRKFKVVGIYETGTTYEDGGGILPLKITQEMQDLKDTINMVGVIVKKGAVTKEVAQKVEEALGQKVIAVMDISDFDAANQGLKITNAITWAISLLAIIIGGIGVMNTIMMSVFERTREIGILRALGWQARRIVKMILGESLVIGLLAFILGSIIGVIMIELIAQVPLMKSYFKPVFSFGPFLWGLSIGLLVSLLGGLYPALRAARFSPLEAIRYE